jgi:hypothetical protein
MKKMKTIIFSFLIIIHFVACSSQSEFKVFINNFKILDLPIESIQNLSNKDSLDGKQTNDLIIRGQEKRPQFVDKSGNLKAIYQYYGLYPEEPFKYKTDEEKDGKWVELDNSFRSKIIPIGQLNFNPKFKSVIIKVIDFESTFYDLWNFSQEGKVMSVVCLFWGMRDAGPRDEKVTFIIVDSKINKEGDIIWHENADGLETFRTYRLNSNGYFQILKEETKGETEF